MMVVYKSLLIFKTHIYALLTLILSFYSPVTDVQEIPFLKAYSSLKIGTHPNNQFNQVQENHGNANDSLLFDYVDLVSFSEKMRAYGRGTKAFSQYFEEGLYKSLAFYRSSSVGPSEITDLIKANLYRNSDLNHPIERPQATKTNLPLALSSLSQFTGEWHGYWKKLRVHHLWLPVRKFIKTITDEVTLMGFQSCFTGDGFGWNYVVRKNNQIVVLGFVIHFDNDGTIKSKNPHYAFLNDSNQLIWISEDHVYCEFICNHSKCSNKVHYVISGAGYKRQNKQLKLLNGFQTIYSSDDQGLPAFKSVNLNRMNF